MFMPLYLGLRLKNAIPLGKAQLPITVLAWALVDHFCMRTEPRAPIDPIYRDQMKRVHGRNTRPPKATNGMLQFPNFLLHGLLFFQKFLKICRLKVFIQADLVQLSEPIQGKWKVLRICCQTYLGSNSCSVPCLNSQSFIFITYKREKIIFIGQGGCNDQKSCVVGYLAYRPHSFNSSYN